MLIVRCDAGPSPRAADDGSLSPPARGRARRPVGAASTDGRVIGYLLAFDLLTLYANGVVTEIQELVVDPAYRGLGVGSRLVTALIDRARARGSIEVTVPTRRAEGFYMPFGFKCTASYFKLELTRTVQ